MNERQEPSTRRAAAVVPAIAGALSGLSRRVGLARLTLGRSAIITLSLEGTSLRLLRVQKGVIERWTSLPFNPRLIRGGRIEDPRGLAEVIGNGLGRLEGEVRTASLVVAFPTSQIVIRYISVPRVRGVAPDTVIAREARRVLGPAADQQLPFWTRVASTPVDRTYYLLAVPRVEMTRLLDTLQRSGLKPRRIEARPLALARAMPEHNGILLRLEATDLSVTIMVDRAPQLVTRRGLDISMSPQELLSEIADAVQTTVVFHGNRPEGHVLPAEAPIFILGAHPQIDDSLMSSIRNMVGREVRLPESPLQAPPDFPALEYMVNLGLALKVR